MISVRQCRHFQLEESGFSSRLHSDDRGSRRVKLLGAINVIRGQTVHVRGNAVHYCFHGLTCLIRVAEAKRVSEFMKGDAEEIAE